MLLKVDLSSYTHQTVSVGFCVEALPAGRSLSSGSPDSTARRRLLCDLMERCGRGLALSLFVLKEALAAFDVYVYGLFFLLDFFVAVESE